MKEGLLKRVDILMQQSRYPEAKKELEVFLEQYPTDFEGRFQLIHVYLETEEYKQARKLSEVLLEEEPYNPNVVYLSTLVELADEKFIAAESKAELVIEMMPEESVGYELKARANFGKRNYDKALADVSMALQLDPENVSALNLKALVSGILGNEDTSEAIREALQLDPENASSIANHGFQLLREGKVEESLDRLKEALNINPHNEMARYAMKEALKSRFLPYRMFFKFKEASGRLSASGSWGIIIAAYVGYRIIGYLAESYPFLQPLVYLIFLVFVLTWVIDPLINLYLLTNKYGKLLLSKDEKKMAQYTGVAFIIMALGAATYFATSLDSAGTIALFAFGMMIPLGTFLMPVNKSLRKTLLYFTLGLLVAAIGSIVFNLSYLIIAFFIGLFAYQWVFNGIMIKDNSRVFGD